MLPTKIQTFIENHKHKPLSEYIKENPKFILEFINTLNWEEKFELLNDFIDPSSEIDNAIQTIHKSISLFLEKEIKERIVQNISKDDYLFHKAVVEAYEKNLSQNDDKSKN
ncbi:hypothetical protein SSYRP_v1c08990 [Spiroplasma syrphidicola EA-1]|uniref:Uncharacterized protein n=1 Tax=Spiroplasma syrphidicola EA-1 TaxID=1276229 RepID=R4U761_9MOLU|nr:hypothetical protein [Spiroplasma syrphidicola]AGM26488.1 hypothetical protein SSYRP_v1c08990 [Spiroplasma syrphidicola EA-1]